MDQKIPSVDGTETGCFDDGGLYCTVEFTDYESRNNPPLSGTGYRSQNTFASAQKIWLVADRLDRAAGSEGASTTLGVIS